MLLHDSRDGLSDILHTNMTSHSDICLLDLGMRVVFLNSCQKNVLGELHSSHPGIVKMKSLANVHVWWPEIDKCIEQLVKECETCESVRINPSSTLLHLWSWLDAPWKRILLVYFKDLSLWSL